MSAPIAYTQDRTEINMQETVDGEIKSKKQLLKELGQATFVEAERQTMFYIKTLY